MMNDTYDKIISYLNAELQSCNRFYEEVSRRTKSKEKIRYALAMCIEANKIKSHIKAIILDARRAETKYNKL